MGKKAQVYKNTISYDVSLGEDGGTLLDVLTDNKNPNPAEAVEAKEAVKAKLLLVVNKNDERKKGVVPKRYRQRDLRLENRAYDFLTKRNEYGFGIYNPEILAEECGMFVKDFRLAVGRLDKKAKLIINEKVGFYYLPDEIGRTRNPNKITDEVA